MDEVFELDTIDVRLDIFSKESQLQDAHMSFLMFCVNKVMTKHWEVKESMIKWRLAVMVK